MNTTTIQTSSIQTLFATGHLIPNVINLVTCNACRLLACLLRRSSQIGQRHLIQSTRLTSHQGAAPSGDTAEPKQDESDASDVAEGHEITGPAAASEVADAFRTSMSTRLYNTG